VAVGKDMATVGEVSTVDLGEACRRLGRQHVRGNPYSSDHSAACALRLPLGSPSPWPVTPGGLTLSGHWELVQRLFVVFCQRMLGKSAEVARSRGWRKGFCALGEIVS
jgi:hypothetical protein